MDQLEQTGGWVLSGGQCIKDGQLIADDVFIEDGYISDRPPPGARCFDASGLIIAPGIIDLHGDGFERNFSPRPGVFFDIDTALIETDRQLIANGITTAYLAVTISWEPGLRGPDKTKLWIDALERLRPELLADIRFQFRWETHALDVVDQVEEWLQIDPKPTLAFNDHFTGLLKGERRMRKVPELAARAGLSEADFNALIDRVAERRPDVPAAIERLAKAANRAGVTCLAHDERNPQERQHHRSLGVSLCEFPLTHDTAADAVNAGEHVVLGAPNVLRGGSHIGAIDAEPAIEAGLCTILASDYYYPSLLGAAGRLAKSPGNNLAKAWSLISTNVAASHGLSDRGTLEHGRMADIIALKTTDKSPIVEAVFRMGQPILTTENKRLMAGRVLA